MNKIAALNVTNRIGYGSHRSEQHSQAESGLRDYLRQLRRNWRLLFVTVVIVTGLTVLFLVQATPRYKADVLVQIVPPKSKVAGIEVLNPSGNYSEETLNSEKGIILSRALTMRVIRQLKLEKDPEFNPALRDSAGVVPWIMKSVLGRKEPKLSKAQRDLQQRVRVQNELRNVLTVGVVARSRLINISISSTDGAKAAKIANAYAELYLIAQLEEKFKTAERATKWLAQRTERLRQAVEKAESAVEAYKRQIGFVKGREDVALTRSQITELSTQLILARAKQASVRARLRRIEKLLKSKRGVESAAEVLSSVLIQQLRQRESELIGKIAELSSVYGTKHPKMVAVRAEMQDLRRKIKAEVRKIVFQVRGEEEVVLARVRALEQRLQELEQKSLELNRKAIKLRTLEREAKANKSLLETVLARYKEATAQQGIQTADAQIVAYAAVPSKAYFPRIGLTTGLGFLISLGLGIGLIAVREKLDSYFRSSDQIEALTGYPVLELVPFIRLKGPDGVKLANFLSENPTSPFVESVRGLYLSIIMSDVDDPPKTILVTSTASDEGKSSVCYALARTIAASPAKVLLIDCDLRRPVVHKFHGLSQTPGLLEYLMGSATQSQILHKEKDYLNPNRDATHDAAPGSVDAASSTGEPKRSSRKVKEVGLDIIPAGHFAANPGSVLSSDRMKRLLKTFSNKYDYVLIDSPPIMALNDARILAKLVDKTLFVVRWGKVERETVMTAVKRVEEAGNNIAGIALNSVDYERYSNYDHGFTKNFNKKYGKYYNT